MYNFAIIIPYYKLTFFRETLESLAAQSDQQFHVYIGNDASPEDPEELLREFRGKFHFTYKKFDNNLGCISLTKQWERCIEMMHDEEWFQILGDDDYLDSNFVRSFNESFSQNLFFNYNVIKCLSKIVNEKGEIILDKSHATKELTNNAIDCFIAKAKCIINSSLSEHIFSYAKYKDVKFRNYPIAWHSDDFAILQFSDFGKIYILKEALCYVRMSTINISGLLNNLNQKKIAGKLFYNDIYTNLDSRKLTEKQKYFLADLWSSVFPKKYNYKVMQLYFQTRGLKGVILYIKIIISTNFNKL